LGLDLMMPASRRRKAQQLAHRWRVYRAARSTITND
jgi:hypothetical protein